MKHNYQLISHRGKFFDEFKDIDMVVSAYINWHKDCGDSAQCKAEIHRGYEILEDCGGHIP